MKCVAFLMLAAVASAAVTPAEDTTGKPLQACIGKNTIGRTYNVRHETDCSKFYKCVGHYGFEVSCPILKGVQLLFNEELQVCDWEGDGDCDGSSTTSDSTSSGSTSSGSTGTDSTTSSEGTTLPNCSVEPERKKPHADKHKYYQCVDGEPVVKQCPQGQYFNQLIAECDIE